MIKIKEYNNASKLTIVLLIIYLIAIIWILLFKLGVRFSYMEYRVVNLIPFREPLLLNSKMDFGETTLNVIIFIPLGIYAGVLLRSWNLWRKIYFFYLTSLIIESLQFIFRIGAFDITDTITNTFGGLIGFILFKSIEKFFVNSVKAQKFINMVAAIGTALMIILLVLLKTNHLGIRYQ